MQDDDDAAPVDADTIVPDAVKVTNPEHDEYQLLLRKCAAVCCTESMLTIAYSLSICVFVCVRAMQVSLPSLRLMPCSPVAAASGGLDALPFQLPRSRVEGVHSKGFTEHQRP